MTRALIDTSAYSAFRRGDAAVVSYVRSVDRMYINPIALGELRAGFAGGDRADANEIELQSFLASRRVMVIPVDGETSVFYAAISAALRRAGTPIPGNDLWIAATAMQHGLRLVTSDAHFARVPQIVVDRRGWL